MALMRITNDPVMRMLMNNFRNQDGIKAGYKNGILTLALPKKEEVRIRKQIQVA
jgi:HSP20 family molecular chaperone IbpA